MHSYDYLVITAIVAVIQFFGGLWVKVRLESSIQNEYNESLEKFKLNLLHREQAARVAELLAKWISKPSINKDDAEFCEQLNRLCWEMAIWIPDEDVVVDLMKRLNNADDAKNIMEIIVAIRKSVLGTESEKLKATDIVFFHRK